ncbi:hypothetical protein T492DRAFT_957655 [Pavlovales sp. CCMP2436]|nr:hypothetical protein T492DRAFT_957655 [Pavlovales sp. CCMP2436]
MKKGERQVDFAAHCPVTSAALEAVPGIMTDSPFGFAFFSTLHSHSNIAAHTAPCNLRVRCHLPLRLPTHDSPGESGGPPGSPEDFGGPDGSPGESGRLSGGQAACGMELAGREVHWRQNELLLFDDSYEHSVWNWTSSPRVMLLLDLWHPGLSAPERGEIEAMFKKAHAARATA